jgi:hypothetical protein
MNIQKAEGLLRIWQTWLGSCRDACDDMGKELWDEIEAALAAAPTPPAQEDEPVYQVQDADEKWFDCSSLGQEIFRDEGRLTRTLYTRPDKDKLRKAAEEAAEVLEWYHEERMATELRAALEGKS